MHSAAPVAIAAPAPARPAFVRIGRIVVAFGPAARDAAINHVGLQATASFAPARAAGRRVADHV